MDTEIRTCFSLYVGYIKNTVKHLPDYDYNSMTIKQIRGELDIIYMKYILVSSFISETAIGVIGYKHIKKMIDDDDLKNKYYRIESELKLLGLENTLLKQELNDLRNKVSSTLFSGMSSSQTNQSSEGNGPKKGWFTT